MDKMVEDLQADIRFEGFILLGLYVNDARRLWGFKIACVTAQIETKLAKVKT